MGLKEAKSSIFKTILSALYPDCCMSCSDIVAEGELLCEYCFCMLERCRLENFCLKCGSPKEFCVCKKHVFHFDFAAAPFYNSGIAKRMMHKFKFRRKEYIGEFFARYMALMVKQCFMGVDFDYIAYVPMKRKSVLKRGYNQSRVLADGISRILKIRLLDNALGCRSKKHIQHKLKLKYRFKNVKDIYYHKENLNSKTILLVDDIKTSGATLDACAKALYAAGASRVYCITGLVTKFKNKKKKGNKNGN